MKALIFLALLGPLVVLATGCTHQPTDYNQISSLLLGENKKAVVSIQAAYYRHVRHPDAPYFYYLDFQMNEADAQSLINDHGFSQIIESRISEIHWPKGIVPPSHGQFRLYENPTCFLVKHTTSPRLIFISNAYAR